jgi:hypothetical protein
MLIAPVAMNCNTPAEGIVILLSTVMLPPRTVRLNVAVRVGSPPLPCRPPRRW